MRLYLYSLFSRLFPILALRKAKEEILILNSELSLLRANHEGLSLRLQQTLGQLQTLESSQAREVESLRHMVDWFAIQSPQRQQMFGTLPESSIPKREVSPIDSAPERITARRLVQLERQAFLEDAEKLREAMERGRGEYFSARGGEVS